MWPTVIGFLVVHPNHAQAPVSGLTVFSKQFVIVIIITCIIDW